MCTSLFAQEAKSKEIQRIFSRIEEGIETGSIDKFASYFSSRNYLSLSGGTAGYYSQNQTFYVIKDFFSINQPLTFKLTNIVADLPTPFAAGTLRYINRGIKSTATVFISLQWIDHQWKISQVTIN
jgi:hypothetical protein